MKKIIMNLKNNKKLMNWSLISCLSLIVGISLILNIIYIPKYVAAANHDSTITTEITIDAVIGDPNKNANNFFNPIEYGTNFPTLGDLIKNFPNRYAFKSYPGAGDLLTGVSKNNDRNYTFPTINQSWFIYLLDNSNNQWILPDNGNTGMDLLTLHNNDQYRLALHNYSTN